MMTLNENYEQEVLIPVHYVDVPKNIVVTSGETDTVRVTVSDKGIILATYLFGNEITPIRIDFKTYSHGNGQGIVSQAELKRMVVNKLAASSKFVNVKPERLLLSLDHMHRYIIIMVKRSAYPSGIAVRFCLPICTIWLK